MTMATPTRLDPHVDQTLEVLLAPGQKARLSPLVESAQINLLTGLWPDDRRRHDSTQTILKQNQSLIDNLARTWNITRRDFSATNYETPAYMQMYASYYFSVNVCKLQILLLDLARMGLIGREIHGIDIGVGTGSTAVALLDFFYALGLACHLHDQPFPIEDFRLVGVDRSSRALDFSMRMVSAYSEALRRRMESLVSKAAEQPPIELLERIYTWSQNVTWQQLDLDTQSLPASQEINLVVISNALNEFSPPALEHVEKYLGAVSDQSLAVLIEPGDQGKSTGLMKWRASFLSNFPEFKCVAPCGNELSHSQNGVCASCWAARRESFHQPPLYLSLRSACEKITGDKRTFDDYDNNLLSWSYTVLQKDERLLEPVPLADKQTLKAKGVLSDPTRMRILGKFHKKPNQKSFQPVDYPVDKDPYRREERLWHEYYKICSLDFPGASFVVLERSQGFQLPRLRFSQEIVASNLDIELFEGKAKCFRLIPQKDGKTSIVPLGQFTSRQENGFDGFLNSYSVKTQITVDEFAYRLFGFPAMRSFQHDILSRVLTGKSVLGIAATGGGKSECYILPAMILPGITVVISPLRSLMTDQYDQRISQRYGLGDLATYINGDVPFQERQARLKRMELGYYKLVYFTPEQLERGYILDSLRRANQSTGIRYLAMDEAHCISQWGHDFRPSYLNIVRRLREYGICPTIIALTATASPRVRQDICEELGLNPLPVDQGGDVFVYSSNRPELNLEVRVKHSTNEKVEDILDELRQFLRNNQYNQNPGSALVFMPHTGGNPENTWRYLPKKPNSRQGRNSAGVTGFASYLERILKQRVAIYHGKMESEIEEPEDLTSFTQTSKKPLGDLSGRTRVEEQTKFINSVSTGVDIMVATKGFGMGIDKPNIRLVIHRSPTTNMEAYAQEAGRAGRDGEMATAILYYSPDATTDGDDEVRENGEKPYQQNVKSDHQIQEAFLSGRYIRREDVIVMRAFLRQVQHRLPIQGENGLPDRTYLYFTCDEAIEFFDQCQYNPARAGLTTRYEWPKFPERESYGKEFSQHKEILDRGHTYTNKTGYINRILAALFRIRPTIAGQTNRAFLESVQETGARVHINESTFKCNWPAIYHSNAYFGEILRKRQVTESEFGAAIRSENLLAFAKRLNLTIKELVSILNDIKLAEGRFVNGRWQGDLLNFTFISAPLFGPASNKTDLQAWRDYAGAYRRSPTPKENAKRNRRDKPTIDDYFSWKEVSKSIGWEVLPGPAFETDFPEFLKSFMQLHDERKQNDWASYYRLLTDYIGVRDDGSIPPNSGQRDCLRSVLLGYLESYEVVVDGQCYSCSHCVPDGNYEKYEWEKREKAVTRMKPGLVSLFKELKEYEDNFPPPDTVRVFFEQMASEEAEGRALYRYFIGWTGRLLDESPDHQTAKWLRLEGMARGVIPPQPYELLRISRQLFGSLPEPMAIHIDEILESFAEEFGSDPDYFLARSQIARRLEQQAKEAAFLEKTITAEEKQGNPNRDRVYISAARLAELTQEDGPLSEDESHKQWSLFAGRTADEFEDSLNWYERTAPDWDWETVLAEIEAQNRMRGKPVNQSALFVAWLKQPSTEKLESFNRRLEQQPEVILEWPAPAQRFVLPYCSEELILNSSHLIAVVFESQQDEDRILSLALKFIESGGILEKGQLERLTRILSSKNQPVDKTIRNCLRSESKVLDVIEKLLPFVKLNRWQELEAWMQGLAATEKSDQDKLKVLVEAVIPLAASAPDRNEAIPVLQETIIDFVLVDDNIKQRFFDFWLPLYFDSPTLLENLLQLLASRNLIGQEITGQLMEFSNQILDRLLEKRKIDVLATITQDHPFPRWKSAVFLVNKINKLKAYIRETPGGNGHKVEYQHLVFLRNLFNWQKSPEEADMLASVLMELRKEISPGYKTPLQMLVEVLVLSGRASLARDLTKFVPDIFIRKNRQQLTVNEFIASVDISERPQPISEDYMKIVRRLLLPL